MARLARVIIPGMPHHVTQRGNGRSRVFFSDADYALYRDLLVASCREADVALWAYCLMPTHVHLIVTPRDADGLRRALAPVHRRYAGLIHQRRRRTGHFWQGRFGAVAIDERHLAAAFRYVALNPVRARLVGRPQDWKWSSARTLMGRFDDGATDVRPARRRFARFADLIEGPEDAEAVARLRQSESIGRPVGSPDFLAHIEALTARKLAPQKRGPKPKLKPKRAVPARKR
jgi:putative transposase